MSEYPSDLEIAQAAEKAPISEIAENLDIESEGLIPFGNDKAKITYDYIEKLNKIRAVN